jgi:UDP-N-acetylglucosamine 2-epimerase (non-hydrolysing)
LKDIAESLLEISGDIGVVFPVHPRTRQRLTEFDMDLSNLHLLEPLPYVEFLALQVHAAVVITDSGGIQEETTYLGIPCLTMRENTERPVTVSLGTNVLVGGDRIKLKLELSKVINGRPKRGTIPELWDGCAGKRIAKILYELGNSQG